MRAPSMARKVELFQRKMALVARFTCEFVPVERVPEFMALLVEFENLIRDEEREAVLP